MQKRILAIDYGTKRIGLAISRVGLAEPLTILTGEWTRRENLKLAAQKIKNICETQGVGQLVLGLSENGMAERTKGFAKILQEVVGLPLDFFDETLSSKEVAQKMRQANIKKKKRQGAIDHYAAAEILEQWLEQENYAKKN